MRFDAKNKEEFNKPFEDINKKDKKGRTALHYAVGNSDTKTVRLLIEKGTDVNAADVGATPSRNGKTPRKRKRANKLRRKCKRYGTSWQTHSATLCMHNRRSRNSERISKSWSKNRST
jgi:ankyrin repeat protein